VDFFLLVLTTAVLYIRPTDFVSGLENVPLYLVLIVSCILASWNRLLSRLSSKGFRQDSTAFMVVGILLVSLITNLVRGDLQTTVDFGSEFGKVALYYLLVVAVLDSPRRLRRFLSWLVVIDLFPAVLALLQYYGMINIPAFKAMEDAFQFDPDTGESTWVNRLHGTGNFGDPNDVCEILNTAMIFSFYGLMDSGRGRSRLLWMVPIPVLGLALFLTRSRGGFLGAVGGFLLLFWARYGRRKCILLAAVALPAAMFLFSGRQTSLSLSEGTSQQRIQLWSESFQAFRTSPIWGIGTNLLGQRMGLVAHNSFVHAYAELGFVGGTFFFGAYYTVLTSLARLGATPTTVRDPELRGVRPYIMAAVLSCAVSRMSLSLCYSVSTYAILGVGAACVRLADAEPSLAESRPRRPLAFRLFRASLIFLIALYVMVRLTLRW